MTQTTVVYLPIGDIMPYENNPRNNKKAIDAVAASIKEFGFKVPIIIDSAGVIVAGHTRLEAAKKLGYTEVPVIVADDLTPEQIRAFRLADNRVGEIATWDDDMLAAELEALQEFDIDMTQLGFTDAELEKLLPTEIIEDEAPEVDEIDPPTSKLGEVYQLGRHRLMCGSATEPSDIAALMDGAKADMVFTDPPYNVAYVGKSADALTIMNDQMSDDEFYNFLLSAYQGMAAYTKLGGALYVCHADSEGLNFRRAFTESGFLLKQCIIWAKQSMVMGRQDYHWKHEPILYGWLEGGSHYFTEDRTQTTVWDIDRPSSSVEHPTMKPIALCARAIQNSSKPGQIVLDVFGGSGSTLIAAEQTDRTCYMMELDPRYVDVIIKRWEELTGGRATKVTS